MAPGDDIVYLGERIDNLREAMSEVGRSLHGHLDRLADEFVPKPVKWWERPAKVATYLLMGVIGIATLGWLAKESLLPEGYLERFLDALLQSVERVGA